jgi:hypothetical protein
MTACAKQNLGFAGGDGCDDQEAPGEGREEPREEGTIQDSEGTCQPVLFALTRTTLHLRACVACACALASCAPVPIAQRYDVLVHAGQRHAGGRAQICHWHGKWQSVGHGPQCCMSAATRPATATGSTAAASFRGQAVAVVLAPDRDTQPTDISVAYYMHLARVHGSERG